MVSKIYSAQIIGLKTDIIDVEVDISKGLRSFSIVGLADKAIDEAKDRINAAIKNSGFKSPQKGNKKIIVSLAPANIHKEGSAFDLAIALGFLLANKEIEFETKRKLFVGELALNGELRAVNGALLIAKLAKAKGFEELYLPAVNAKEASLISGLKIFACHNLKELTEFLSPKQKLENGSDKNPTKLEPQLKPEPEAKIVWTEPTHLIDFADIKSQTNAKRGLEIAAAGGHNVAMYGPPGTGKTMLAKAFAGIMPPLSIEEIIEATGIHSAAGVLTEELIIHPAFRSPHHTSSYVSLVGGGAWPKPGEITLAHRGVLFLDEFPEFDKRVIEALRQPLEDRVISVSRSRGSMTFPASFILVAAMNPCPCGYRGSRVKECNCAMGQIQKYERKVSGPIVDRIDLWLDVPAINHEELSDQGPRSEASAKIRQRVIKAREKQAKRFEKNKNISTNSEMGVKELKIFAPLSDNGTKLLNDSAKRLSLSARAYHRVIKLARTIADLANSDKIKDEHLLEALQYRPKNIFE